MVHELNRVLILATLSFLVAFGSAPILIRFLVKKKLGKNIRASAEAPVYAKLHANKAGTPTMGGVLVWGTVLGLILGVNLLSRLVPTWQNLDFLSRKETLLPLGALIASALVGLVDDVFNIKHKGAHGGGLRKRHRLTIYALIATVGALWFYFKLDWSVLHVPFFGNYQIDGWIVPFFMLVIIATGFTVNETDGLDGLAGGILLTSFAAYAVIAFMLGRYDLAVFCAVIIGALMAFLWFNIYPAKFFMGDTGAMPLGVTLGVIAMLTNYALLLPLIGIVLIIEAVSVLLQWTCRSLFKHKLFISSPLHHHLEAKGWAEPNIVMRFWIISIVAAAVGVSVFLLERG
ncbi:MAG: phospho-N-acetylmuramoyl-pentapeptide-transferase [Patescibacteria group bacterium]|jgi:phospho-N-acetylmuramoyl-pentapeptide-transferase